VTDSSDDDATVQLHEFYTRTRGAKLASLFTPASVAQARRIFVARMLGTRASELLRFESRGFAGSQRGPFKTAPLDSMDTLFRRISSTNLIVTGRFHLLCMAMLARTPFLALSGNTHKVEGMLEDAGLSNRYFSSLSDGRDPLAWSEWHDGEAARIEAYLQKARSKIAQMFARIRQLAID
jgi:Polysaccharide pyruvyl transferase